MEQTQYKYIAFVSYRHNAPDDKEKLDEQWAKRIQDTLESYRLPNAVFKSVYKAEKRILPKRLYPIFRDASDLGVGTLKETLAQNLNDSKFLIVICTPRTAQPNEDGKLWVDEEVKYFADTLGRQDRIIPILVSGTPNESFVPTLKKYDCLALDVGKFPKERIVNDIVAKILGLNPDELWNRELRRRRRQRIRRFLIAAGVAVICALGGWFAYDWNLEKQAYFADYVDCRGVPSGLHSLRPEQILGRGQAYRFHYQGYDSLCPWKRKPILRKVFCVNSFGHIRNEGNYMPQHAPAAGRLFLYDEQCVLTKVIHLEINGITNSVYNYSGRDASFVDVFRRGWDGRLGTSSGMLDAGKENVDMVRRYRITRDSDGHVRRTEGFRDARGVAAKDAKGVHRTDYGLDDLGRVVSESYFSWNGQSISSDKYDSRTFKYDKNGNVVEIQYLNNGKVALAESRTFDQYGNCLSVQKNNCAPVGQAKKEISSWTKYAYDSNGECCLEELCDANGRLLETDASRRLRRCRFSDGRLVERDESYFNSKGGQGSLGKLSRHTLRFDENMRVVESIRYGGAGRLFCRDEGAAYTRRKYDAEGREVDFMTFDADEKPWSNKGGVARQTHEFADGENGALLRTLRYFDTNNNPICTLDVGGAKEEMLIDKNGRLVSIRLFGTSGEPIVGKTKWHKATFQHNKFGFLSEIAYWGIDGNRVLAHGFGAGDYDVAIQRYEINAAGQIVEQSLYGVDEKPMIGGQGWSAIRKAYDGKGQLVEVFLFGKDGRLVEPRGGINCHTQYEYGSEGRKIKQRAFKIDGGYLETEYDDKGQEIANREFNPDGSPCADKDGVHAILFRRDAKGREIKKGYLDVHGKRVLCEERYAALETRYDKWGSVCEEVRFGVNGELVNDKNGVCIVRWHFDGNHRDLGRSFYDTRTNLVENKNGAAGVRKAYDANGNKTEDYSIDRLGRAIPDGNGVAICHSDYDACGRIVRKRFLDAERHPILSSENIAGWVSKYDRDTQWETTRFFIGTNGMPPCVGSAGQAGWLHSYDDRGNVVREVNVDVDGKPFVDKDGTVGWVRKYDEKNRPVQEFRIDGDLKLHTTMICDIRLFKVPVVIRKCEIRYDDLSGHRIETMVLDKHYKGISKCTVEYDREGNRIDIRFEDDHGNLVNNADVDFAHVSCEFDEYGDLHIKKWYDANNELKSKGCAKLERNVKRMKNGITLAENFYDAQGFPTSNEEGISFAKFTYDMEYRLTSQEFYNEKRLPCTGTKSMFAKLTISRDANGRVIEMCGIDAEGKGAWGENGAVAKMEFRHLSEESVLIIFYDSTGNKLGEKQLPTAEARQCLQETNIRYSPQK